MDALVEPASTIAAICRATVSLARLGFVPFVFVVVRDERLGSDSQWVLDGFARLEAHLVDPLLEGQARLHTSLLPIGIVE